MEISSVPLSRFYKYYSEDVCRRKFKWMVTIVARDADAEAIYDNLRKKWLSLNSITGEYFLFVFAGNENHSSGISATADPSENDPPAAYRPYDWRADKEGYLDRVRENQTDAVNSLKKLFCLNERDIPCLVFTSLMTNRQYVVPIDDNADDLYGYFKSLLRDIERYLYRLREVEYKMKDIASEIPHLGRRLMFGGHSRIIAEVEDLTNKRKHIIDQIEWRIQNSIIQKQRSSSPVPKAHPLGRQEYLYIISNYLSQIAARLDMVNPNNLMDFNQCLEQTYCGLLNRVFGWQLRNLNRVQMNIPGIDLACETGTVCVQISSDASSEKIRGTLKTFFEKGYDSVYTELYIVFTRKYRSSIKNFDTDLKNSFAFTFHNHVLDTAGLFNQISTLETAKLAEIANYLGDELGNFPNQY